MKICVNFFFTIYNNGRLSSESTDLRLLVSNLKKLDASMHLFEVLNG